VEIARGTGQKKIYDFKDFKAGQRIFKLNQE